MIPPTKVVALMQQEEDETFVMYQMKRIPSIDFVKLSRQERIVLKISKALTIEKDEWSVKTNKLELILKYCEYAAYAALILYFYNVHLLTLAFPPLDEAYNFQGKYLRGLMFPCTSYFSIPNRLTAYKMPRDLLLSLSGASSGAGLSLGGDVGVFPIAWCLRKTVNRLSDILGMLFQEVEQSRGTRVMQAAASQPVQQRQAISAGGAKASTAGSLRQRKVTRREH
jgi:hypothetical protein